VSTRSKEDDCKERDKKLDEAIAMTFPASDPIAVGRPTSTEAPAPPLSAKPTKVRRARKK